MGNTDNESIKFATRKWCVITDQNNTDYGDRDEHGTTIKFETKVIKSNLYDFSDAHILVTGGITATGGDANTKSALKNCAPFTKCVAHINDELVVNADSVDIAMPMYNLIEYNENYSETLGSLWQFNWDEQGMSGEISIDVTIDNSQSSKYKSRFLPTADNNGVFKIVKINVKIFE